MKFRHLIGIWLLLGVFGFLFWNFKKNGNILSPLGKISQNTRVVKRNYKVFGFLPSWNVGKTITYTNEIDRLVFLGIEVDELGNLIWDTQSKKIKSDGYREQSLKIKRNGGKNILGVKLFDDDKIIKLMSDESAKSNLIEQINLTMTENNFDGVNIDIEYQGDPLAILGDDFYYFVQELNKSGVEEISVDVFANTIIKGESGKLNRLMGEIDDLIVMAYDFHRAGMDYAGPVAPIGSPVGERNILEVVQKINEAGLDRKKMTLAYPLYGYEWKTDTEEFGSRVKRGWIAMASYKRMKELVGTQGSTFILHWDEESMSPWISYVEDGEIHQIYYENLESLKRKFKLSLDNQLGGIGFWALGYEGENRDIWEELNKQ
jgi:spore germination protein YaaH